MALRTSNPALKDDVYARAAAEESQAGWAAPSPAVDRETVSAWTPAPPLARGYDTMTVGGVVSASAVLIVILMVAAFFGYQAVEVTSEAVDMPGWILIALLGGLGTAVLTIFKPKLARFTAPIYAALEGLVLGSISHVYEAEWKGIVLQAVGLTVGVFLAMLFLYATRIIKVTDKLRMGVFAATGAIALVYVLDLVVRLFGGDIGFIHSAGGLGIAFSLIVVGVAAFNLLLDFDLADRGAAMGAPKYMEWYTAFGFLVTLVWLYLELLRLLAKLRSR